MRRDEFACEDADLIRQMLGSIAFGTLIVLPYAVPMSFCYEQNAIFLHGAAAGRKYKALKTEPAVAFSAAKPYAYISSRFLRGTMIPTQFFFSVLIEGRFRVVEDAARKREILGALVRKYEPQNADFSMSQKQFKNSEKHTFVGLVEVECISAKAKFGQNLAPADFECIINELKERNLALDSETIELMRRFRG